MTEYYDPETYPKEWNYLQSGTIVDQYIIERELAHGGFSSVYLARQIPDQTQVAIKEYLPRRLAHRTWNNKVVANDEESKQLFIRGRTLFFEEAKVLAKLKHHNIVDVINFFQANATVYMVMTYDYGITLDRLIQAKRLNVDIALLRTIFAALLDGIAMIHNHGIIHADIKPANILIRPGYDPLLLDFGAIQTYPPTQKQIIAKILSHGFSPIEQYSALNKLGPWTDIYAFGASIRACLDGKIPPPAPERLEKDVLVPAAKLYRKRFPEGFLQAVDWAMEVQPEKRPQHIDILRQAILSD